MIKFLKINRLLISINNLQLIEPKENRIVFHYHGEKEYISTDVLTDIDDKMKLIEHAIKYQESHPSVIFLVV